MKRTHGPFTWVQQESQSGCEVWDVERPDGFTFFGLKNYGGEPGPGFAGWKLVSGGPFDDAGAYSSLDDAIIGVTPWLVDHYCERADEMMAKATKMYSTIQTFRKKLL